MKLHCTNFCWDCIDRQIVQSLRIEGVISDHQNHEKEKQRLIELLCERERLAEEAEKMGKQV